MLQKKTAFITGINGFVGSFLSEHLAAAGWSVAGLDRFPACDLPGITYFEGDLLDTAAVAEMLAMVKPERVFHLAGISFLPDADFSPRRSLDINIMGSTSILDAARQSCPSTRLLLVGSSKEYRDSPDSGSITEDTPRDPGNFYGISKYAAELIGLHYVRQYGMDVRFTRSFNHTGPGQSPRFVCSDWSKQAAAIKLGLQEPKIRVGDIAAYIDFTDVRDVVRAYALILEKGARGEAYNVCSGKTVPLRTLLDSITAMSGTKVEIEEDETKLRRHKTSPEISGSHAKLTRQTGWEPEIPLSQTLADLFTYWLSQPPASLV